MVLKGSWSDSTRTDTLTCEWSIHHSDTTPMGHEHTHDASPLSLQYQNKLLATWTHPSSDVAEGCDEHTAATLSEVESVHSSFESANITSVTVRWESVYNGLCVHRACLLAHHLAYSLCGCYRHLFRCTQPHHLLPLPVLDSPVPDWSKCRQTILQGQFCN